MDQDWDRYRILGEQAEASSNYPYAEAMWAMTVLIAQHFGDKDPRTPYSLDSLSRSLMRQQKFTLAEHFLSKAWTIKTQVISASALEIATTMNLIAELYYRQGKYQDAIQMCKKVHGIYHSSYGANHPKTHEIAGNIAMLEKMANPVPVPAPVQTQNQAPAPQQGLTAPNASTVSQAAVQAPAAVNPAPSTSKKRSGMPRCEVCGSVMEADWCFRCTGNSVKAVNPGQQLT
jgi:tetratricopeptide (TPR) repeat protein